MPYANMYSSNEFGALLTDFAMRINREKFWINKSLEKVIEYIFLNITKSIQIHDLLKIANMSERTFRNIFKKYTNKTPKKYIDEKVINLAKELLNTTNLSVKEIAYCLGFEDQYYFNRAFKKQLNCAPSTFRKLKGCID